MELTAEVFQEVQDRTGANEVELVTPEMNEAEQKAHDAGWRPQAQWEGDPEDWVSAREYLRVGEMMDRIKSQGNQLRSYTKKLDQMETALTEMGEHNKKIKEQEYNKALEDLKDLKADALRSGDMDAVVEIDDKMGDLKDLDPAKDPQSEPQPEVHPDVEVWLEENTWYEQDTIMRGAAEAMMKQITDSTPGIEPKKVLDSVLETMKEEFPHKFGGTKGSTRRVTTAEVDIDGTTRARTAQTSSNKFTARHLNDEQQKIGKTFVRTGALESLDVYAAQLGDIGELDVQQGGV